MEMIVGFIIVTVVANCLTIQTNASNATNVWAVLSVPDPPSIEDQFNRTWIWSEPEHISLRPAPYFSINEDVRFELFTLKNPIESQILKLDNSASVKNSNFNSKRPTRIFVHGWNSEGLLTPRFADAYLVKGKHNVNFIALDWTKGSDIWYYPTARKRVTEVADHLANFIHFLVDKHKLKLSDLTIIGHSLGAHIAGLTGKRITKGKVAKIVGLDPASPLFKYDKIEDRLHETDAAYVEVMHTSAGTLGFSQPIGKASFYPNGGRSQPGCKWDVIGSCAHARAYEYYIESIINPLFYAFECDSYEEVKNGNCRVINDIVQMGGEPGNKHAEGIFYLQTNPKPLFSQGRNGVIRTITNSLSTKKINMFSNGSPKLFNLLNGKLKHLKYEEIHPELKTR